MEVVYVGLGSNLDSPIKQVLQAFSEFKCIKNTHLLAVSSLYQTTPWGILDQDDFINACVKLKTTLSAEDLFYELIEIEKRHFRIRKEKNGPRTLDCDLLLYGDHAIETDLLTVPHPGITHRGSVLVPLAEIAPNIILSGQPLSYYLKKNEDGVEKLIFSEEEIKAL